MRLFLPLAVLLIGTLPHPAQARARPGLETCALASQREVARRHGLRAGADNSSKIYANPAWAAEADNLFDACVKR